MESLTFLSLREMTIEQLKDVFKYSWNSYSQYFYLLEDQLSYYALRKWSKTLHWSHPAARRMDVKLHKHEFRGKKPNVATEIDF